MRVLERQVAGQLQVERDFGPAADVEDGDVVHLAYLRHAERGGVRALPDRGLVLLRLDVDDDVAPGKRIVHRGFHAVGGLVSLADGGARGDGDHDVRELARARLTHAQPPDLDRRFDPGDRGQRRLLCLSRRAVHQHVDVPLHQPCRGQQHERRDEQRCCGASAWVAGAHEHEPYQDGR